MADHPDTRIEQAYRDQRSRLWGLAYRMTGTPSEADDVLQETFTRAIANPPSDRERELGPWLMRVAVNLAIDRLRKRKLAKYVGPWLPGPVETSTMDPELDPAQRFANLETITAAFLRALELLSPKQRAVLILSQVLEYSGREVSQLLDISEPDVRTSLSRARRLLAGAPCQPPSAILADAHRAALQKFLAALSAGSPEGLMALFVPEARGSTDGGGQYRAALKEIVGAERLTKFWLGLRNKLAANFAVEERELNGLPALWSPSRTIPLIPDGLRSSSYSSRSTRLTRRESRSSISFPQTRNCAALVPLALTPTESKPRAYMLWRTRERVWTRRCA